MTSKTAAVFALDVSCSDPVSFEKGRQVCLQSALEKMLYAPHDELGLVFTGAASTLNPLYDGSASGRFEHIVVERAVSPTNVDFLIPLENLVGLVATGVRRGCDVTAEEGGSGGCARAGPCDFLDTIRVCAQLLEERTERRRYSRVIYLITDARAEVREKGDIQGVLELLRLQGTALVVIGIDFLEHGAEALNKMEALDTKGQNEVVLRSLCEWLGGSSMVISLDEAVEGLSMLRRRKILQRPLLKVTLSIGDVRIATQLFTKTQEEKLPSLQRCTASGEEVTTVVEYADVGGDGVAEKIELGDRIKAYHYGRSLIPCTDGDLEAMKITGPRSLIAIAFVEEREIPPYILMGGVKVLLPLAGDAVGQRGFSSLVRAMLETKRAMVTRLVRTRDARPVLGVCLASAKPKRDALYFAPLPFAEDVRHYSFPDYGDIRCSQPEEELVAALVAGMTVGKEVLRPSESYSPVLAQYYATLREKAVLSAQGLPVDGSGVPPLIPQTQATSTAFTSHSNPIAKVLAAAVPALEDCAAAFPFVPAEQDTALAQRGYWFRLPANIAPSTAAPAEAPSTVNAYELLHHDDTPASSLASNPTTVAARGVSTIDPVGTFLALVAGQEKGLVGQQRAMDELAEVTFQLLRHSLRDAFYRKCDESIACLRGHCVREGDANYYNSFLIRLSMVAKELGHGEEYWEKRVVRSAALRPITREECMSSSLADASAASAFLSQDRSIPQLEAEDVLDDALLDLIS